MERKPAVAGQFYPGTKSALEQEVLKLLDHKVEPQPALAAIVPHAGYVYSGKVAGLVFANIEVPARCIIISPNHTGMGAKAAIWPRGFWTIPTGNVPVDETFAKKVLDNCSELADDYIAHLAEHSLEVELPFLLARKPGIAIVPITLSHLRAANCRKIGEAIASVVGKEKDKTLIVASTDMNHYEDQANTLAKDQIAIDRILKLDPDGLLIACGEQRISMCGVVPTAVLLHTCIALGAQKVTLIDHKTSGDVSGDYSSVVGYAGFIIS